MLTQLHVMCVIIYYIYVIKIFTIIYAPINKQTKQVIILLNVNMDDIKGTNQ